MQIFFYTKRLASFTDFFGGSKKNENVDLKNSPVEKEVDLIEKPTDTVQQQTR